MHRTTVPLAITLALATASALSAQAPLTARAEMINAQGQSIGQVRLVEIANSRVWIELDVSGLPPGVHAFHIHQTGSCEPPTFESAGGHYAPEGRAHGIYVAEGPHAGDLLNLHVPQSGAVHVEQLATRVTLRADRPGTLFDDDGSALVIHEGADDYRSQPTGDAGGRLACGVVTRQDG